MSSEESNKMSKKTPSQDSNSDIEWDLEELKKVTIHAKQFTNNQVRTLKNKYKVVIKN